MTLSTATCLPISAKRPPSFGLPALATRLSRRSSAKVDHKSAFGLFGRRGDLSMAPPPVRTARLKLPTADFSPFTFALSHLLPLGLPSAV